MNRSSMLVVAALVLLVTVGPPSVAFWRYSLPAILIWEGTKWLVARAEQHDKERSR